MTQRLQVSVKHPNAVMSCNVDLEKLITDSNRSIATLAITTLLKTGAESSVERLMKQISSFVSEIGDEFKVGNSLYSQMVADYCKNRTIEKNTNFICKSRIASFFSPNLAVLACFRLLRNSN